ncbi:MAG: DUF1980 domain-containing protein [Microbacterium arborescens]
MPRSSAVVNRLFGVGLAAALAAITVTLALTGRIGLYINPESAWFAVGMSVLGLIGAVVSFALPLGAEADHGHDHGHAHGGATDRGARPADHDRHHDHDHDHGREPVHAQASPGATLDAPLTRRAARAAAPIAEPVRAEPASEPAPREPRVVPWRVAWGSVAAGTGGLLATGIVAVVLVTPPATLSAELAMSRDTGTPPLFQGADTVALATTGDTDSFGVGEWASVFATATNPEAFEGDEISLSGFVTPSSTGGFGLTRLVITHCVIDAQPASIPIGRADDVPATGEWVTVTGVIRDRDGALVVEATGVQKIEEPEDPYEY